MPRYVDRQTDELFFKTDGCLYKKERKDGNCEMVVNSYRSVALTFCKLQLACSQQYPLCSDWVWRRTDWGHTLCSGLHASVCKWCIVFDWCTKCSPGTSLWCTVFLKLLDRKLHCGEVRLSWASRWQSVRWQEYLPENNVGCFWAINSGSCMHLWDLCTEFHSIISWWSCSILCLRDNAFSDW